MSGFYLVCGLVLAWFVFVVWVLLDVSGRGDTTGSLVRMCGIVGSAMSDNVVVLFFAVWWVSASWILALVTGWSYVGCLFASAACLATSMWVARP